MEYITHDMKLKAISSTQQIEVYEAVKWINDKPVMFALSGVYNWLHEPTSVSDLYRQFDKLQAGE